MKEHALARPAMAGTRRKNLKAGEAVLRLILCRGEVYRLPRAFDIRVLSGAAWVTVGGQDAIRVKGQTLSDSTRLNHPALVSPLGDAPLVLEILDRRQ